MTAITEKLATAARKGTRIPCPFRRGLKHPAICVCMGTGKVKACQDCQGSGWNATGNKVCSSCQGKGALAVAA